MFAEGTPDPPIPTISDPEQLARFGVLKVPIPDKLDATQWAFDQAGRDSAGRRLLCTLQYGSGRFIRRQAYGPE
jgi:hypothetical protein